ncbi:hypothetical protein [Bifidobacterium castoris]|uniref:Uncharacterized protein n=1 Tax=Bifidobacterium castoris TaxID=2306972 RepID=A0A430F4M0_9BIFI|nr:hypothetical protein [Bifidobacterium castoris]RSX44928.1 hypothetical protein D2E22_1916 [Bifidobacterium castoris]
MGYESLSTIVVLVMVGIIMAIWLPRKTVDGMKTVMKHRSDRYSTSLHLVDEQSGTTFNDVDSPKTKGAIMPATQREHGAYREYREHVANVRKLRRAAAHRRKLIAGALLTASVVVLVLAFVLHFSPWYTLIPAGLLALVCALGVHAAKQARAWEAKVAAKEQEHRRRQRMRPKAVKSQAEIAAGAQPSTVAAEAVTQTAEETRTDVMEQREIRRALHQARVEQAQALARRQAVQQTAQHVAQEESAAPPQSGETAARVETAVAPEEAVHAQLVVREEMNAYPPDETNELSEISPASAVDAFDMAINQDLISFSLGAPRNGVEHPQEAPESREIKSTKQVAKAEPKAPEADVVDVIDVAETDSPTDAGGASDDTPNADVSAASTINDSAAFHESERTAAVEAPDETSDSLGSSLESILARRGN